MEYPVISIPDNYLLIVDTFDYISANTPYLCVDKETILLKRSEDIVAGHKILAHLPLNGNPPLEGVPLLPATEKGVEQLALEEFPTRETYRDTPTITWDNNSERREGFIKGYKANKKQYTEEDIWKLLDLLVENDITTTPYSRSWPSGKKEQISNLIKSLKPQPIAVEVEIEHHNIGGGFGLAHSQPLQTTIKPLVDQNGFVIVKKWIYE